MSSTSDPLLKYEKFTDGELEDELERLLQRYVPDSVVEGDFHTIIDNGMDIFGIVPNTITEDEFTKRFNQEVLVVASLQHVFVKRFDIYNSDSVLINEYKRCIARMFEILYYLEHVFKSVIKLKKRSNSMYDGEINTEIGLSRFHNPMEENHTPYQELLEYLYFTLRERGYRRQGEHCMKRVYTPSGHESRAWESAMTIKEFVYKMTDRNTNRNQYMNRTRSAGNTNNAISELENTFNDIDFPDVIKDRRLFAFLNGVYETSIRDPETLAYRDCFYYHTANEMSESDSEVKLTSEIPTHRSACNYIRLNLNYEEYSKLDDWYDIPTPNLQMILDYQKIPEEACRWLYILLGRLLYDVGDLDGWQVMPFLKGRAGTGKSTLLNYVCRLFYDPLDVGVLANNCQTKWALSGFHNKLLFIGPEVQKNLGLEQTEFQTIISGEATGINQKNKDPFSVKWKVPGIISGNQAPQYDNSQGQVSRRLAIFEFGEKVKKGDTQLDKKLQKELPTIIYKCNRAYINAINEHGTKDIVKEVLPEYFKKTMNSMAEETNDLVLFLNSDEVVFGKDYFIPKRDLFEAFKKYCSDNNLRRVEIKKSYYKGPFDLMDVKVKRRKVYDINRQSKNMDCCIGIDLKVNVTNYESNAEESDDELEM